MPTLFEILLTFFGIFLIFWALVGFFKNSFLLRFLIFFSGVSVIIFTIFPHFLRFLGKIFGLERGADLLVYASVGFLLYMVLFLLQKNEKLSNRITHIIREMALQNTQIFGKKTQTTIVMAAYNESAIIAETIEKIFKKNPNDAIIVINDGSRDATLDILKNLQKKFANLIVISHSQNLGQGAALETGFEYIRRRYIETDFVSTFDADGQMEIADLSKMTDFLANNPQTDIVLGSRFLGEKSIDMPFFRKIILKIGIIFTKIFSRIQLTDTHNGFRVFRSSALGKIRISLDGMGHASEILDIISREKLNFHEMPVTIHYTAYSLHKGQKTSNSIKIALQIIFKNFF